MTTTVIANDRRVGKYPGITTVTKYRRVNLEERLNSNIRSTGPLGTQMKRVQAGNEFECQEDGGWATLPVLPGSDVTRQQSKRCYRHFAERLWINRFR